MIYKNKIELIEKYLNEELTGKALSEFNEELTINSDLDEEIKLQLEIQKAIEETDIFELRNNLQYIINNEKDTINQSIADSYDQEFSFELSEELSSFNEFNQPVNINDLINLSHSLPKIHLVQHNIASKENIHHFYNEQQNENSIADSEYSLSNLDEAIFEDVQAALEENDIQDLRANLQQIAASIPTHQRTSQEIEQYNHNELDTQHLADFEQDIELSINLQKDIELHNHIDLAAAENDIINLRASLQTIQQTEVSTSQKVEEIDQYINDELMEQELTSFENELANSSDLATELDLHTEIDKAIQETELMKLRYSLKKINQEVITKEKQKRSFATKFAESRALIATIAASLILILSITGLISRNNAANDTELYSQYYQPYETTGIFRSGDALIDSKLTNALHQFNAEEYLSAIALFSEVLQIDKNNPVGNFYSGIAYQETGQFNLAMNSYQNVIKNKDNLFIEQANWYIGLCYLQTENRKKAYKQFKKIANSDSFYQEKASAILRKIKHLE